MRLRRTRLLAMIVACMLMLGALCGCDSYHGDGEDLTNTRPWGTTVSIEYNYDVFLIKEGPWYLDITPLGIERLNYNGHDIDTVKLTIVNRGTQDNEPAEFAHCTTTVDILDADLNKVPFTTWLTSPDGSRADPRSDVLEKDVVYTYWIPLRDYTVEKSGLCYVTVSDRSGIYSRTGDTYWFEVTSERISTIAF